MKKILTTTIFCCFSYFALLAQNKPTMRINHAALSVQNLEVSTKFYKNLIGLEQIDEPFKIGKHSWFNIGNGAQLHLIAGAQQTSLHEQNTHLCFSSNSLTDFMEKLKLARVSYVDASGRPNQITTRPDGIKQLWIKDPDGYWLEINDANRQPDPK